MAAPNSQESAINLHQEPLRWSLSSLPGSHGGVFSREAILLSVPPSSGVYGLFNADYQLYIGESANIRDTLLLHEYEAQCQSELIKPTGFTFQLCSVNARKHMADDLIAKFNPVLQTGSAFTEKGAPSAGPKFNVRDTGDQERNKKESCQSSPVGNRANHAKVRQHLPKKRKTALASIVFASAIVLFYFGTSADDAFHMEAYGTESKSALADTPLEPQQLALIDAAGEREGQNTEPTSARPDVDTSTSTSNAPLPLEVKRASASDRVKTPAEAKSKTESAKSADLSKTWSVQLTAAPTKAIADKMAQRLRANGYESYVLQAKVKKNIYYRVRVGRFATKEEAESVRRSLTRRDGYKDAYLTDDQDAMKNS